MGSSAFVSGCSVYIGIGCLIVVAKSRSFSVEVDKSLSAAVDDVMTHQIAEFFVCKMWWRLVVRVSNIVYFCTLNTTNITDIYHNSLLWNGLNQYLSIIVRCKQ